MDLALLQVSRDGLLRRSEASALTWGDLELQEDGSGRVRVARSKTDQTGRGTVLYLGPDAVSALLGIRPTESVRDTPQPVFGLSTSQIGRRVRTAALAAGLGEGFSGHSMRVGMAQDLSSAGAELPALMQAGRGGPVLPGPDHSRERWRKRGHPGNLSTGRLTVTAEEELLLKAYLGLDGQDFEDWYQGRFTD